MSFQDGLRSLLEIIVVLFTVWAIFHEDKFIVFEEKLFSLIKRRRLKVVDSTRVKSSKPVISE